MTLRFVFFPLPASSQWCGWFLRNSLEVAFGATQAAEGIIFVASGTPVAKRAGTKVACGGGSWRFIP